MRHIITTLVLSVAIYFPFATSASAQSEEEAQQQTDRTKEVLCLYGEAWLVNLQKTTKQLREFYDDQCEKWLSGDNASCYAGFSQSSSLSEELAKLEDYLSVGTELIDTYGALCGEMLIETTEVLNDTIDYIKSN